jgi:hypothetical protein
VTTGELSSNAGIGVADAQHRYIFLLITIYDALKHG